MLARTALERAIESIDGGACACATGMCSQLHPRALGLLRALLANSSARWSEFSSTRRGRVGLTPQGLARYLGDGDPELGRYSAKGPSITTRLRRRAFWLAPSGLPRQLHWCDGAAVAWRDGPHADLHRLEPLSSWRDGARLHDVVPHELFSVHPRTRLEAAREHAEMLSKLVATGRTTWTLPDRSFEARWPAHATGALNAWALLVLPGPGGEVDPFEGRVNGQ